MTFYVCVSHNYTKTLTLYDHLVCQFDLRHALNINSNGHTKKLKKTQKKRHFKKWRKNLFYILNSAPFTYILLIWCCNMFAQFIECFFYHIGWGGRKSRTIF